MSYTAEQLREDAHRADGIGTMADGDQLRAHADALEENARLKERVALDDTERLLAQRRSEYQRELMMRRAYE